MWRDGVARSVSAADRSVVPRICVGIIAQPSPHQRPIPINKYAPNSWPGWYSLYQHNDIGLVTLARWRCEARTAWRIHPSTAARRYSAVMDSFSTADSALRWRHGISRAPGRRLTGWLTRFVPPRDRRLQSPTDQIVQSRRRSTDTKSYQTSTLPPRSADCLVHVARFQLLLAASERP